MNLSMIAMYQLKKEFSDFKKPVRLNAYEAGRNIPCENWSITK